MASYRLRDAAVVIGAVIVGAAAGFNGGWLAAVPPKVVTVDTPNKLATSAPPENRTTPIQSYPEPQAPPAPAPSAVPDTRNVRVVRPVEQANEISASAQQAVAPSSAQTVPAPNQTVAVPAAPQPAAVTPAAKTEVPAQAAVTQSDVPLTTGQAESRKSDVKNKSDVKKKSQTASDQKTKRKEIKRQDTDPAETAAAETDRREIRPDTKKSQKAVVQKPKRKELRREEVDSDESEVVESERRPSTTGRSFRKEEREEYERVPVRERARGTITVERERERPPREVVYEEPRERSGPFDFFFGR